MAERFLAAARKAAVEPALDLLGAGKVAGAECFEQRRRGRHGEDIDKAAGRAEHQAGQKRAESIEDFYPTADLVVEFLEMLKVGEHLLHRDYVGDGGQARGELGRDHELAERGIVVNDDRQVPSLGDHPVMAFDLNLAAAPVVGRDHLLGVVAHPGRDLGEVQGLQCSSA